MPGRRRVPVRLQAQVSDCGAACLAMVLEYHGILAPVAWLREQTGTGSAGISARVILAVARQCGLAGKGVRVVADGLRRLPPATILVWESQHYVVLEKVVGQYVYVVDPGAGRRRVDWETAVCAFSGVALVFSITVDSSAVAPPPVTSGRAYRWSLLPRGRGWIWAATAGVGLLPLTVGLPLAVAYAVDQSWTGRGRPDLPWLLLALGVLSLWHAIAHAGRILAAVAMQPVGSDGRALRLFSHVFSLPLGYFGVRQPTELAWRLRSAMIAVENATSSATLVLADGLLLLGLTVLMFVLDPLLAALILVLVCARAAVAVAEASRQRYRDREIQQREGRAQEELTELFANIATIESADVGGFAATRAVAILDAEISLRTARERQAAVWSAAGSTLQSAAPWIVLVVGCARAGAGALSVGSVAGLTVATMQIFTPLASLLAVARQAGTLRAVAAHIGDLLLEAPSDRPAPDGGRPDVD